MKDQPNTYTLPSPLNSLIGAVLAAVMTVMMYFMTSKIATTFATKPMHSNTTLAMNIGTAVRTLVTGITALSTGIFAIISLGLVALAIKVAVNKTPSNT